MTEQIADLVFLLFALITIGGGLMVAFSRNVVRCAFSLLLCFGGVAGIYALLGADFLAAAQVLVYIGGITVLFLFVLFLTEGLDRMQFSNPSLSQVSGFSVAFLLFIVLTQVVGAGWQIVEPLPALIPTSSMIGKALIEKYFLPFEVASILLLAAGIGAIIIARKELKLAGGVQIAGDYRPAIEMEKFRQAARDAYQKALEAPMLQEEISESKEEALSDDASSSMVEETSKIPEKDKNGAAHTSSSSKASPDQLKAAKQAALQRLEALRAKMGKKG